MTVSNNYAPVIVAANGTATVFSGAWNALSASYLVVQLLNTTTGVYTTIQQGTGSNEYQVTSLTSSGFVITFNTAPAIGNDVVISRLTAPAQVIPYTTSRGFQGSVEEGSFDILTNMVQELTGNIARSIQTSVGDTAENLVLPIASLRANTFLAFDSNGNVVVSTGAGSPTVATSVDYTAPGGVLRTLQSKLQEYVAATDFAGDPTGTYDSTSAIQNAINYLSSGGIVYLPRGTYKYTSLTVGTGVTLQGDGWAATTLETTSASAICLAMGVSSGIKDLQLTTTLSRTSQPFVNIQNNGVLVERVVLNGYWQGIVVGTLGGAAPTDVILHELNFFNPVSGVGTGGIIVNNFSNLVIDKIVMTGPSSGTQPDNGISVNNGDTIQISNVNVSHHGIALNTSPASGYNCYGLACVNSFYDSAGTNSAGSASCVEFQGAGGVYNTKFSNVWFGLSASQSGVSVLPASGGVVDGMSFSGCEWPGNANYGLIFGNSNGGTCKNINVSGGGAGGNTNGAFRITGACQFWSIVGVSPGSWSNRGAQAYGVILDAAASDYFIIANNNLQGSSGSISDSSTGTHGQIYQNNGYNGAFSATALSVSASPFTHTAGHTPEMLYFAGGTVSSIAMDGDTLINTNSASIYVPPNESVTVTYSSTPTIIRKLI